MPGILNLSWNSAKDARIQHPKCLITRFNVATMNEIYLLHKVKALIKLGKWHRQIMG